MFGDVYSFRRTCSKLVLPASFGPSSATSPYRGFPPCPGNLPDLCEVSVETAWWDGFLLQKNMRMLQAMSNGDDVEETEILADADFAEAG